MQTRQCSGHGRYFFESHSLSPRAAPRVLLSLTQTQLAHAPLALPMIAVMMIGGVNLDEWIGNKLKVPRGWGPLIGRGPGDA